MSPFGPALYRGFGSTGPVLLANPLGRLPIAFLKRHSVDRQHSCHDMLMIWSSASQRITLKADAFPFRRLRIYYYIYRIIWKILLCECVEIVGYVMNCKRFVARCNGNVNAAKDLKLHLIPENAAEVGRSLTDFAGKILLTQCALFVKEKYEVAPTMDGEWTITTMATQRVLKYQRQEINYLRQSR